MDDRMIEVRHPSSDHPAFYVPTILSPRKRVRKLAKCCAASPKKVLILGGTGRVGSEAAAALSQVPNLQITLGARHKPLKQIRNFSFTPVNIVESSTLIPAIKAHDVVLHTAGPFQHSPTPALALQICLDNRKPYIDISDDTDHSIETKSLHEDARASQTPALISTGIYPGLSNLLASKAVTHLLSLVENVDSLDLYYHTAGSGGIGATVLAATMLLLSEPAAEYTPSGPVYHPAASGVTRIFFDQEIGQVNTYRLNLPEVFSLHTYLTSSAKVSARFSTAPPIWNLLLQGMARLPRGITSNRRAMQALATFSMPIVKAVDRLSGARTGIVVKASGGGREVVVRFVCERLDRYVGLATAAFVKAVLRDSVEPGVWFPEELPAIVRGNVIADAIGDGRIEVFVDGKVL